MHGYLDEDQKADPERTEMITSPSWPGRWGRGVSSGRTDHSSRLSSFPFLNLESCHLLAAGCVTGGQRTEGRELVEGYMYRKDHVSLNMTTMKEVQGWRKSDIQQ